MIKVVIMALCLLLVPLCFWHIPRVQHFLAGAVSWREQPFAPLWFLLCAVPYCSIGLPKQALGFAAGIGFGVWEGGVLSVLACEAGAMVGYAWGAVLWAGPSPPLKGPLVKLRDFMRHAPFRAVLVLRLMPVGSALLLSLGAGALRVPFGAFAWASLWGSLPQIMVFVLSGAGGHLGHHGEIIFATVLFLLSALLGARLLQRYCLMS